MGAGPGAAGSARYGCAEMFPVHDWQFWVATVIALAAAVWVVRGVAPVGGRRGGGARRVKLTISGEPVKKK